MLLGLLGLLGLVVEDGVHWYKVDEGLTKTSCSIGLIVAEPLNN